MDNRNDYDFADCYYQVIIPANKKTIHLRKPSEPSNAVETKYRVGGHNPIPMQTHDQTKPKRKFVLYH